MRHKVLGIYIIKLRTIIAPQGKKEKHKNKYV